MKFKESSKKIMSMFLVGIMIFTTILNILMSISHGDNLEEQISVEEKTDIKKDGEEIQLEKENIEEIEEIDEKSLIGEKKTHEILLEEENTKEIEEKEIKDDSLIKAENKIVYIVTDKDETLTKEKYKEEYGEVIVTNHLIKIFEEVKNDITKYLTKEEAENKDLIVIFEKDINFKEEIENFGKNPNMVIGWDLKVHENLNSFKLIGKEEQKIITGFNFLTQSVKTETDNINLENRMMSGGYGYDVDLTIKNSYIGDITGIGSDKTEHPSNKESKININIEDSTIKNIIGVSGSNNEVANYTYEFDFNIKDSKISKFLGAMFLNPKGNYLDVAEKKVKINYVNITTQNTDFQHFNGVLNSEGTAGMGAEVGDVNINLDNIKIGKIDGMESSYPYSEGYMIAIMDSTGTMADYSFGNINFSMNKYSIEKDFNSFLFTSMNPKEANVNINKIDLKLTDGGDKNMGESDHYLIGYLGTAGRTITYPEYEDLIHPINFNVAKGINVELEKIQASDIYVFVSYTEKKQTPKNMSINSDINIKIDDQEPGKAVYYLGLGANVGFNGDIVYNYGGIKASTNNYLDIKVRKDIAYRFEEYLEENQSGNRIFIYNPKNIVKGENVYTGKKDSLGIITGFKEIYLSTPLRINGSDTLKQYAEAMKETKLYPLTPYKVENDSIVKGEWKLGDKLIIVNAKAGKVPKDTFIQGWTENPPYDLDYFPSSGEEIQTFWFLTVNITLHGNGGKFKNGEYDFYQIHVSDEDKKLLDYLQESDTDNYFELDGDGNIVLDNEGKPIDLKPVHPDGLEFIGWTISKDGSIEEDENNRIDFDKNTVFTKNLHIYAKWKEEKVKVEFNTNGGSNIESQEIVKGETATKPIDPSKENHKFIGWYLDEDLKEEFKFDTPVTEDIILYAKWEENKKPVEDKFKVTFDANGGKFDDNEKLNIIEDIENGSKLNKDDIKKPKRTGYIFKGWYKLAEPNKYYTEEDILNTEIKEDKYVYAKWTKKSSGGGGGTVTPPTKPDTKPEETVNIDYIILANGDKHTDVLTSTVLGNELKAPILLTKTNYMDEDTKAEIKRLNPKNIIISGGDGSVSEKLVRDLKDSGYKVERLSGNNRYATAREIAKKVRSLTGVKDSITLVDGTNFPDGITINSLAGKYNSPIHLTNPNKLNSITKKDIKDFNIKNILIGGGNASVSENTLDYLKGENIKVERISGKDRYKTAVKISERFTEK